eukprot:TRINITY_DN21528_c0_g1_i5.p2 TRINITY_DN21528_c0_g1~~TRINITY_DN21528_c0_g1_i5.p2  ORF type:complete len:430 (-),score=84.75 TRINITY_DN21528_c0_g1_i5:342-1529(-)
MIEQGLHKQHRGYVWKDRGSSQQQRQQERQTEQDTSDQQADKEQTRQQQQQLEEVNEQEVPDTQEDNNQSEHEMPPQLQNSQQLSIDAEIVSDPTLQQDDNQIDQNMTNSNERQEMDMDVDTDQEQQVHDQEEHQNERLGAVIDTDDLDEAQDVLDDSDDMECIDEEIRQVHGMEIDRYMKRMYDKQDEDDPDQPGPSHRTRQTKPQVGLWCSIVLGQRHIQRYIGHCNIQTDIKEAVFLGQNDEFVAAGSDGGQIIIYDTVTGMAVKNLRADNDVANCIQCHPYEPVLATSGIESTVKLWSPQLRLTEASARSDESELTKIVQDNQERMKEGPRYLQQLNRHMWALLVEHPEYIERMMFHGGVLRRETNDNQPTEDDEQEGEENQNPQVSCIMN